MDDFNSEKPEKKKIAFNLDFNLGHLFVIFSLFLSAAGLYAHDESRVSILETQVTALDSANLNTRVTTNETKIGALTARLDGIHDVLLEIRNELAQNHQETVKALHTSATKTEEIQQQANTNTKAIKSRIFP